MGLETLSGVFEFVDRNGVPLPMVLQWMREQNYLPCWVSYIVSSKNCGWKKETVLTRIETSVCDVHGKQYWKGMEEKTIFFIDLVFDKKD